MVTKKESSALINKSYEECETVIVLSYMKKKGNYYKC